MLYALPQYPAVRARRSFTQYFCHPQAVSLLIEASQDDQTLIAEVRELFQGENYGISAVERLPRNIGRIALSLIPEVG
jgi:hypothetical protein